MALTLAEFLSIPKGMDFKEYEKLLDNKRKLEKQITKASNDIYSEEDSLEILANEIGSERYNRHLINKRKAESKRERAQNKLELIKKRLG